MENWESVEAILSAQNKVHEARATNSNGDVSILMTGTVTLKDVLLDIV